MALVDRRLRLRDHVPVTTFGRMHAAAIERGIHAFLATGDSRLDWLKAAVRKHGFLPLLVEWIVVIGIRPDGEFISWDHEHGADVVESLRDFYWERVAIYAGAKQYPDLASLIPDPPAVAQECPGCEGTGKIAAAPKLICQCGGLGWIVPGEEPKNWTW